MALPIKRGRDGRVAAETAGRSGATGGGDANPFVVGGAINDPDGAGFYARQDVFDFLRGALTAVRRPPILLLGQRRIGKSSILRQLPRHLPPDYLCVYYDLQGRAQLSLDEVLYGLGRTVADAAGLPRPTEAESNERTIETFLLKAIAASGGRPERLVLLFDEFDVIDQQFAGPEIAARRFIPFLADLVSRQPRVGYILVVGRRTEELSDGFFSALLKDAVQKKIGRLQRADTAALAVDAFGADGIAPEAIDAIVTLAAGHPFCTQVLCYAVWHRRPHSETAVPISAADVDAALPHALELGTLGLNWVYDGLEQSSHRLFLSALAGMAGPRGTASVGYETIHDLLFKRRLGVDENQLRVAPIDLRNWDVLEDAAGGFRFAVPMIGLWIRHNRGIEGLEQETRRINPRAAKYHELASESQQRGAYEQAIEDYRKALAANPVFAEAQLGLATALRARNQPGDLEQAVEAFERVLDLDPGAARAPLVEALLALMESETRSAKAMARRFERIRTLDTDGIFRDRATRLIERTAHAMTGYGTTTFLRQAVELFDLAGNAEGSAAATRKLQRVERLDNRCMAAWLVLSGAWLASAAGSAYLPAAATPGLQLLLAGCAGLVLSMNTLSEHDGQVTVRRWIIAAALLVAVLAGMLLFTGIRPAIWPSSAVAFMVVLLVNLAVNPTPPFPTELLAVRPVRAPAAPLRSTVAGLFERWAKVLRASGRTPGQRG